MHLSQHLLGYDDEIKETARITENRIELNEELKNILNKKLEIIQSKINNNPKVTITYFIHDGKKKGGKYQTITGIVRKIDDYNKIVILMNGIEISVIEIVDIIIV